MMSLQNTDYWSTPPLSALNEQLSKKIGSCPELDRCPVCRSNSLTKRFSTIRHIRYSRCRACGFTFSNPVPTNETLDLFYNSNFYLNYRRFEENRMDRDPYYSISMYTDMSRLANWLGQDKSIAILDYGCGTGAFLAFLRDKYGFQNVQGIELSSAGIAIGKQKFDLPIVPSRCELHHRSYDCVLLLEVIEHVPNPDIFFEQVVKFVKPSGSILITTPAVDNFLGLLMPSFCLHFTGPSHISMFTEKSMSLLLSRFGFRIERLEIDKSNSNLFYTIGISLLYKLDFMSPRNDDDSIDILYIPNSFGRFLKIDPQRQVPRMGIFGRFLRGLDRLVSYAWQRLLSAPRNEHLYVLARKTG